MNRNTRLLIVLVLSLGMAAAATYFVYRTISQMPAREVEIARAYAVVAARPLALGTKITPADVKLVGWPADSPVAGGFASIDDVVNRGVLTPIVANEPITTSNVAAPGAGAGLPPTITPGMRAVSVRVNEVIGVAGFVVPGTRVDVMVVLTQGSDSIARVVVSNVQVLTAGTRYDQEEGKAGNAMPSSVVTLLVSPQDAEKIALASTQGQLMLTLRNPLDTDPTPSGGTRASSLAGGEQRVASDAAPVARPRATVTVAPPPAPAPVLRYTVEVIRGAKRSEETVKE